MSDYRGEYSGNGTAPPAGIGSSFSFLNDDKLTVPDSAALDITGNLEVIFRAKMATWDGGGSGMTFVSKGRSAGWEVYLSGTTMYLRIDNVNEGSCTVANLGLVAGRAHWIRVARNSTTGAIDWYVQPDSASVPTSWGSAKTDAGAQAAGTIQTNDLTLTIGATNTTGSTYLAFLTGEMFDVVVKGAGSTVFEWKSTDSKSGGSFVTTSGQTVTIDGATFTPLSFNDYWVATSSGTLNKQNFYPGARLLAQGTPVGSAWKVVNNLPPTSYITTVTPAVTFATAPPSQSIIDQFEADIVRVVRRVDIFESDGVTAYALDVGIEGGSVSVDMGRNERRNIDLRINDETIGYGPGEFWYDKIIKPYRGIQTSDGNVWLHPLGTFMPDNITRPRFPAGMSVTGRDLTKKLILDKFGETTTFVAGTPIVDIIEAIAINGGITNFDFQSPTDLLQTDATFDVGSERMAACVDLATSINHEVFFNAYGAMVLRPFVDPYLAPTSYTFLTGVTGNLVDYGRSTSDTFMFNDIVVYGSANENALVVGRATNTDDLSPTSVNKVGRRTKPIPNQFVADNGAALAIAQSYLSVSGLEQYDLTITSIVAPWLEAGDAILALLPDAELTDPDRFLLSSFTIPLGIEPMSATAKRVILVG